MNLAYAFDFADPIFRLGNDYSKGIILATGYVGQRTANSLVTCLTDGHPGVSGGGVLNRNGELVGIPIGRMQGDFRFSFILPLRQEMFKKSRTSTIRPGGFAPPDPPAPQRAKDARRGPRSPSLAGAPCPAPLRRVRLRRA